MEGIQLQLDLKFEFFSSFTSHVNKYWPDNDDLLSYWQKKAAKTDLKDQASRIIKAWMKEPVNRLKMEFLDIVDGSHRAYWSECFAVRRNDPHRRNGNAEAVVKWRLVVHPPFWDPSSGGNYTEPAIDLIDERDLSLSRACAVSQICCISTDDAVEGIQLIRKDGVPLYLAFKSREDCRSFLTLVGTYFRLCEKWTFKLCDEIKFPHLEFLFRNRIHGPVDLDFVKNKFESSSRLEGKYGSAGTFLIRQCDSVADRYFIHYREESGNLNVIRIDGINGCYFAKEFDREFSSFKDILSYKPEWTGPSMPALASCLRPSEFDSVPNLLICSGPQDKTAAAAAATTKRMDRRLILFDDLKRIVTRVFEGRFTMTFKGQWTSESGTKDVAIEQLKTKFRRSRESEFLQMVHDSLRCQDATIRMVFGITLPTNDEAVCMIKEFFNLGPLDRFLQDNRTWIEPVVLVEAGTSLARACGTWNPSTWFMVTSDATKFLS